MEENEKQAVLKAFAQHVENQTLPSLKEIQEVKKNIILLLDALHRKLKHGYIINKRNTENYNV